MATETSHHPRRHTEFLTPDGMVPWPCAICSSKRTGVSRCHFSRRGPRVYTRVETLITLEGVQGADRAEQLKRLASGTRRCHHLPHTAQYLRDAGNDSSTFKRLTSPSRFSKPSFTKCAGGPGAAERLPIFEICWRPSRRPGIGRNTRGGLVHTRGAHRALTRFARGQGQRHTST